MRPLFFTLSFLFLNVFCFSQNTIEGDRLLDLVGKSITDPLAVQLKQQESFLTDAWSSGFTVYLTRGSNGVINEVELENGKLRYGSKTERYGYYSRKLPLGLNWNMTETDLLHNLGKPVIVSAAMNFKDYRSGKWSLRVFFEDNKMVSVSYKLTDPSIATTPVNNSAGGAPADGGNMQNMQPSWIIKVDNNGNAQVSWPALKKIILSVSNFKSLTGNDSVDYIGQVYYNTDWKVDGFKRSAIKRRKKEGDWFYEAFFKTEAGVDSEYVRKLFFSLYDNIKKTIKDNTGDDFILASVARQPISHSPVNWIAQWTLSSNYKTLPAGLPKFRIAIMVSGMKNVFKDNKMEYTFKVYVNTSDLEMDFFVWDKPL